MEKSGELLRSKSVFSVVSTTLTAGEMRKLDAIAQHRGVDRDAVVSMAIEEFLRRSGPYLRTRT